MINFPHNVHCLTTPRYLTTAMGQNSYDNFNLATQTGDNIKNVLHNRVLLQQYYQLPNPPKWLNQTHSDCALCADDINNIADADASWTQTQGVVCAVLTADCLPIFISHKIGDFVGIIHAGYQGLLNGVIEGFIKNLPIQATNILVHIGVGISQDALALDEAMYQKFIDRDRHYQQFFIQNNKQYYLSMPAMARYLFVQFGIKKITQTSGCTYREKNKYFSYRRQGKNSGRMASLIWFN